MKTKTTLIVIFVITLVVSISTITFFLGMKHEQDQIINRSLEMNKDCYTGEDLGYIILGSSF